MALGRLNWPTGIRIVYITYLQFAKAFPDLMNMGTYNGLSKSAQSRTVKEESEMISPPSETHSERVNMEVAYVNWHLQRVERDLCDVQGARDGQGVSHIVPDGPMGATNGGLQWI